MKIQGQCYNRCFDQLTDSVLFRSADQSFILRRAIYYGQLITNKFFNHTDQFIPINRLKTEFDQKIYFYEMIEDTL